MYSQFSGGCLYHQEFQVPEIKMEVLNLISLFWGVGFPYISLKYRLHRWGFLHFRYLKCLVNVLPIHTLDLWTQVASLKVSKTESDEMTCNAYPLSWSGWIGQVFFVRTIFKHFRNQWLIRTWFVFHRTHRIYGTGIFTNFPNLPYWISSVVKYTGRMDPMVRVEKIAR